MVKYISLFIASFTLCVTLLFGASVFAFPDRAQELSANLTATVNDGQQWVFDTAGSIIGPIQTMASNTSTAVTTTTTNAYMATMDTLDDGITIITTSVGTARDKAVFSIASFGNQISNHVSKGTDFIQTSVSDTVHSIFDTLANIGNSVSNTVEGTKIVLAQTAQSLVSKFDWQDNDNGTIPQNIEVASLDDAIMLAGIEPSAGGAGASDEPPQIEYEFDVAEDNIISEVVLVPREKTVISSSRDGKIKVINFANGDTFQEGDILLEYECKDIRAEIDAASFEQKLAGQKMLTTSRLYDLNIASKIDREQATVEKNVARAKQSIAQSKLDSCIIRAQFDGRVVKRLANANEYTRTDRVLMEIASTGTLDAEFLMPSIWLRWINIGAPIDLVINETGREYTGEISRIYGEVDPVSQSIQIRARLNDYQAPLLPGMSGQVNIDVNSVRNAGVRGFLEVAN
jgi:membrane fusion protein (multidrug efflux system)